MKYLKAAVTVRILDSLGVVSKEMQDIRNKNFLVNAEPPMFAGKVGITSEHDMIFLYSEKDNTKFMLTTLLDKTNNNWFGFISADIENEDPESNKILSTYYQNKELRFREVSFFEVASILRTFEVVRDNMPYWVPFKCEKEHIDIMTTFMKSFEIEAEDDEHVYNEETIKGSDSE